MDQEAQTDRNRNGKTLASETKDDKRWKAGVVEEVDLPPARTKPVPAAAPKKHERRGLRPAGDILNSVHYE